MLAALLFLLQIPGRVPQPTATATVTLDPNILVVVWDDVADSDIDAIPALTHLQALAAQGLRFKRAYAHAWCAPSRDSLLRSVRAGVEHGEACTTPCAAPLPSGSPTLATLLDADGYATETSGKWHLGSAQSGPWQLTPEAWGFTVARRVRPIGDTCNLPGPEVWVDDGVVSQFSGENTIIVRDAVIDWWTHTKGPKLAMANFAAGHYPFKKPDSSLLPPGYSIGNPPTNRTLYEAELVGADTALGQLVNACHPDVLVVLGDNGTPGRVDGAGLTESACRPDQNPDRVKGSCYEDGIRIPLIITWRGMPAAVKGTVSTQVVGIIDVLPTLLELAGSSPWGATIEGRSLVPALHGDSLTSTLIFAWNTGRPDTAVIDGRWKLLTDQAGLEALFDLTTDPHELTPLSMTGENATEVSMLREWRSLASGGLR